MSLWKVGFSHLWDHGAQVSYPEIMQQFFIIEQTSNQFDTVMLNTTEQFECTITFLDRL